MQECLMVLNTAICAALLDIRAARTLVEQRKAAKRYAKLQAQWVEAEAKTKRLG